MSGAQRFNPIQRLGPNGTIVKNTFHTKAVYHLNYVWTIDNYSFHHTNKSVLKTPVFSVCTNPKFKWFIILLRAPKAGDDDVMGVFLKLHDTSECEEAFVKFKFSILDEEGTERNVIVSRDLHHLKSGGFGTGCNKFILKDYNFPNEELMPNNRLTIYCEATFSEVEGLLETVEEFNPNAARQQLDGRLECERCISKDFGDLLANQELTDVTFSVADKQYRAHKLISTARSPVFAAMFKHNMRENENDLVEITDIGEEVVKEMLHYIYTDKCDNLDDLALGLLAASNKYDIEGLKNTCQKFLCNNLTVGNASEVLYFAYLHCAAELKSKAIHFIAAHSIEVTNSANWKKYAPSFHQSVLMEIFEVSSRQNATAQN